MFSISNKLWDKYTDEEFEKMGKDIVINKYGGDISKAYIEIVEPPSPKKEGFLLISRYLYIECFQR